MPIKSSEYKADKANKEFKGNKENKYSSTLQARDQKSGHGEGFGKVDDKRQMAQGYKLGDAQNSQGMSMAEGQDSQGIDLPDQTTTKAGCLPKLFVMLLPFVAIGTYLLLRS